MSWQGRPLPACVRAEWSTNLPRAHAGGTRRAFEASLTRLGLNYVDLYPIHQPLGDYYSSWRAMQEINRGGLARAIGVANLLPRPAVDLIGHDKITPGVNQIETHPFHNGPLSGRGAGRIR